LTLAQLREWLTTTVLLVRQFPPNSVCRENLLTGEAPRLSISWSLVRLTGRSLGWNRL